VTARSAWLIAGAMAFALALWGFLVVLGIACEAGVLR
jgi:hypothetical protein